MTATSQSSTELRVPIPTGVISLSSFPGDLALWSRCHEPDARFRLRFFGAANPSEIDQPLLSAARANPARHARTLKRTLRILLAEVHVDCFGIVGLHEGVQAHH